MNNGSKYHAEVKVQIQGREARVNVFADTLAEIFRDLGMVAAQFPTAWVPPTDAGREVAAAQLRPNRIGSHPMDVKGRPLPPQAADNDIGNELPVCAHCGQWDGMELIQFRDKKTGKPKQAWKCQACDQWHFPDKK